MNKLLCLIFGEVKITKEYGYTKWDGGPGNTFYFID